MYSWNVETLGVQLEEFREIEYTVGRIYETENAVGRIYRDQVCSQKKLGRLTMPLQEYTRREIEYSVRRIQRD